MLAIKKVHVLLEEAHRNGRLCTHVSEFDPTLIVNTGFDADGRKRFCYTIRNGRLHGVGRLWFEDGQPESENTFHKGVFHGPQRSWYRNGQIRSEISIVNNQYDGTRREWYPSAQLMLECAYRQNKLEGVLTQWHANGRLKERGPYQEGLRHGIWQEFNEQGSPAAKQLYARGICYTGKVKRILDSGKICAKDILHCHNTALRRILLEELGFERFLAQMKGKVLDRDGDQELIRVNWHKDEEPLMLVKVRCPSTAVFYTLRVAPHVATVREAVAWTFSLDEIVYRPDEES